MQANVMRAKGKPLVSVIIPSYNSREHIVASVTSVTGQTLNSLEVIVVDDCSTDDTEALIKELMTSDVRIRYIKLDQNSGAAGAPRNKGLAAAEGRYVMFLDSDDELERHACKNLLLAAQTTGAFITGGRLDRRELETGIQHTWYPSLYSERYVLGSVTEHPEFVHDTLVTNKLFLLEFLRDNSLLFAEDRLYEDVVYAAQAYALTNMISIIPELVYYWNVYPNEVRKSITNQREESKNFIDRLWAVESVYGVYGALGDTAVLGANDQKTLRHHFRLYLNDLDGSTDEWVELVFDRIRPRLNIIPNEAYLALSPQLQVLYTSVLRGDVQGARKAMHAINRNQLSGQTLQVNHETYWTSTAASPGGDALESYHSAGVFPITGHSFLKRPHAAVPYLAQLDHVEATEDNHYILSGKISDPLHKLREALTNLEFLVRSPSRRVDMAFTADYTSTDEGVSWSARIPAPRRAGFREFEGRSFLLRSTLRSGAANESPVYAESPEAFSFKDSSAFGVVLGDQWLLGEDPHSPAVLTIGESSALGRTARAIARAGFQTLAPLVGLPRSLRKATSPSSELGRRVIYPLLRALPIQQNTALFESYLGLNATDSPRAVYEALRTAAPDIACTWAAQPQAKLFEFPEGSRVVQRHSWRYVYSLARAQYLVDNQSFPSYFVKRSEQKYLQTWHGIPLKKMGMDEPRFSTAVERQRIKTVSSFWDGLNIPNPYFEQTFAEAYGYTGEKLRWGSPRNDSLVKTGKQQDEIRAQYDIPKENRVVLFAPTFREGRNNKSAAAALNFELTEWVEQFGSNVTLLVRAHYLNRFAIPEAFKSICIDVSEHPEINDLYAIADVLLTDYSSVMFDFALLERPIVFYVHDYDQYVSRSRGVYFDLRAEAPGPLVETAEELFPALKSVFGQQVPEKHRAFIEKYCGIEDGKASERSAQFLLEGNTV